MIAFPFPSRERPERGRLGTEWLWCGEQSDGQDGFQSRGFRLPCQIIELTDSLPGQVCWRDSYLDVDFGKISTLSLWGFVNQALVAVGMWKKVGVEAQGSSETG